jgi:hypothetical protein
MSQTVSSSKQLKNDAGVAKVDMKFEVAIVPVSDVDRAKAFYTKLGWRVDDDIVNGKDFRVVQLTPPGSASSISFGQGVTDAVPGSFRGGLIVSDICWRTIPGHSAARILRKQSVFNWRESTLFACHCYFTCGTDEGRE